MFVSPSAIELGDLNITPLQQRVFVVREISPLALVTLRSKAAAAAAAAHTPCPDMQMGILQMYDFTVRPIDSVSAKTLRFAFICSITIYYHLFNYFKLLSFFLN